jgi:hypothetical protein
MNNTISISKSIYCQPQIVCIELDNEISLALESTPPPGPGETNATISQPTMNPFRDNKV